MREINKNEIEIVSGGVWGLLVKAAKAVGKAVTSRTATRATVVSEAVQLEGSTPK